jgi:hypothetical protein
MKRHTREKAVIDHVAKDVHQPKPADDEPTVHSPTTPAGLPVEE